MLGTWMFTPGTKEKYFDSGEKNKADVTILDLEDSVSQENKNIARENVVRYLESKKSTQRIAIRVNSLDTKEGINDLKALIESKMEPDFIVIPKCNSAEILKNVTGAFKNENKKTVAIPMIETMKSIDMLLELKKDEVPYALFGSADLSDELNIVNDWENLNYIRNKIIDFSSRNGIEMIDTPYFNVKDLDGVEEETIKVKNMGFRGKLVIYPAQVERINKVFNITEEQIEWANKVLEINKAGVGTLDGQMIDEAIAKRARAILKNIS